MTSPDPERRRSALVVRTVRAALAVAALAALVLYRGLVVAWFTGGQVGGGTSGAVSSRAGGLTIAAAITPDPPRQ